jgi:UDP-2,3-diacylglucosamine hydrolase
VKSVSVLGIIAGSGVYPRLLAEAAHAQGAGEICVAAFEGETDPSVANYAHRIEWMRVGQLSRLLQFFGKNQVRRVIMAGQIAPKNLYNLRPDLKALLLIGKLKRRNAETLFGAVAAELGTMGVELLPATTYLEDSIATAGLIAGPRPRKRALEDLEFGFGIAKAISRLDVGQSVVVRHGTILAVEAFEGTDAAIQRGASLGRSGTVVIKVSKPDQDMRFDVPVIGSQTVETAASNGVILIGVEAGKTLLLDAVAVKALADQKQITIFGKSHN